MPGNSARPWRPLPQGKIAAFLAVAALVLVAMHPLSRFIGDAVHSWFDLDAEGNMPAWFSAALLAAVSFTAFTIHRARDTAPGECPVAHHFWLGFALVYAFLALDEGAGIHELVQQFVPVKWVYVYLPFAAFAFGAVLYYFGWLRKKDRPLRLWIVGGLVVFAYGGLVCEFISHRCYPLTFRLQEVEFMTEEGLEMLGTIMVLRGCLGELNRTRQSPGDLF